MQTEPVTWGFYGFEHLRGGRPVQEWFDGLSSTERDEILDTLEYLQTLPLRLWLRPDFSLLSDGLSEIRCKVNVMKKEIRIYGFFHPQSRRYSYTFLVGKEKKVNNDKDGIAEAATRKRMIAREEATTHVFKFSS